MRYSITFDSILSHMPAFYSLALTSRSTMHRHKNMNNTKERTSFTFYSKDMLLLRHNGFSFVRAAVVCAMLERVSKKTLRN